MAASGTGSLVVTDDVTADRSNGMNSDVCGAALSAWILTNASKLTERRFTVQMEHDYNHIAKQPKSFSRRRNEVFFSGQSRDFTSLKTELEAESSKGRGLQ